MDKEQFRESLHLGLGRPLLYARLHDVTEFRDIILDACLHCYSYDTDIEGIRADYMHELVNLLPDKNFFRETVLNSLAASGDDRNAVQRFHFAACMATDGDEHAKRVMRDAYNPGPRYGESIGINFLDTDGIEGLLFVAEKMGALLLTNLDEVDIGWIISRSEEVFGEEATWDALQNAGRNNAQVEAYRKASEKSHKPLNDSVRVEVPAMSYSELLTKVPPNKPYLLWKWGHQASEHELELAAYGLIAAREPKEQLRHLRIFTRRRFPLPPDALLPLAYMEEERVGFGRYGCSPSSNTPP